MTPEDFQNRVLDKFDRFDDKISDLCDRTTRMETKVDNHLEQTRNNSVSKRKQLYLLLSIVGSYGVGILTTFLNGGS